MLLRPGTQIMDKRVYSTGSNIEIQISLNYNLFFILLRYVYSLIASLPKQL